MRSSAPREGKGGVGAALCHRNTYWSWWVLDRGDFPALFKMEPPHVGAYMKNASPPPRVGGDNRLFLGAVFIILGRMKKFFALLLPVLVASVCLAQETNSQKAPVKNPATTPVTRGNPTNWMTRHEGFVKQAQAGGIDLLFMGDSITDNWRSRGKNVWDKTYGPRHAANFGIGGDRTQHVIWRIEHGELDGISPKVIVLMIGTNNGSSDSADQISEGVEKIVSDMREKCPKSKILLLAIFPRNRAADKPEALETLHKVNERIAKLDDGKMITFLDINKVFLGPDGKVPAEIMPDFLHPNEHGYQLWADAMEPTLKKMLE
jgi:lysophospholipase L1-like esterase